MSVRASDFHVDDLPSSSAEWSDKEQGGCPLCVLLVAIAFGCGLLITGLTVILCYVCDQHPAPQHRGNTVLVLGGSGLLGRQVVGALHKFGLQSVTQGSRERSELPETLQEWFTANDVIKHVPINMDVSDSVDRAPEERELAQLINLERALTKATTPEAKMTAKKQLDDFIGGRNKQALLARGELACADRIKTAVTNLITFCEEDIIAVVNLVADRGGVAQPGRTAAMNNEFVNIRLPTILVEAVANARGTGAGSLPVLHLSTEYVWSGDNNTVDGYPAVAVGTDQRFVGNAAAPYAKQKREAESSLYKNSRNVPLVVLRVPVLYGWMFKLTEDGTAGQSINDFFNKNDWAHDTWQRRYPTDAADVGHIVAALVIKMRNNSLNKAPVAGDNVRIYHYGSQASVSKYDFMKWFVEGCNNSTMPASKIKRDDVGKKSIDKRPPFDVKLDLSETRAELQEQTENNVALWREPSGLNTSKLHYWSDHLPSSDMCAVVPPLEYSP